MKKFLITTTLAVICCSFYISSTTPVEVADSTLKIGGLGEEVFYYGFAEGDQIIFSFEEVNGKELKEVEITEWPSNSKFMDYKTKKIENKTITVTRTGIYKFRFSNSAIGGRICKFRIERIPASEEVQNFNTAVYWRTLYDTSYTTVQERYLVKSDTAVENITDQVAKVHSQTNANGNHTSYLFTLPANTVSWSYYVGVDQAGQKAYEDASAELAKNAAPTLLKMPGYGPLAACALGLNCYIAHLQSGEDIDYWIMTGENLTLWNAGSTFYYMKKGKVINDYSRMTAPLSGTYHMCFSNDNAVTGVTVALKITAITVTDQWGTRSVQKPNISSRQEPYLKNQ